MRKIEYLSECPFFPGFERMHVSIGGAVMEVVTGGQGPVLLLLHGYPQTHIAWRKIAPILAMHYTLVIPDLPGYGASLITDNVGPWDKRRVASVLCAMMDTLGYGRFGVVGHDRGARVGYRLVLDHPDRAFAYASLTVMPTLDMMERVDHCFALHHFHWFFFAQEDDIAERLLDADPDGYLARVLARMTGGRDFLEPEVQAAYHAAFRRSSVRRAILADYRAALREDLQADREDREAGHKLPVPVFVTWSKGAAAVSPIEIWRAWAEDVTGGEVSGGHLQPEEAPDEVLAFLLPFLARALRA